MPNVRQQADPQQVHCRARAVFVLLFLLFILLMGCFSAAFSRLTAFLKISLQLARIMAMLQQRQQQAGVLGGSSKLSPSHHGGVGGGGPKLPGADTLLHPGLTGSIADMHQKSLGPYSG